MTGYGKGEASSGGFSYVVQIKSVNNRFLEAPLKLPPALWAFEVEARAMIQKALLRGKLDLHWKESRQGRDTGGVSVDLGLASSVKASLESLAKALDLKDPVRLDQVARYPEVLHGAEEEAVDGDEASARWKGFQEALKAALEDLGQSREREGAALGKEMEGLLGKALALLSQIEAKSAELTGLFAERMKKRLAQLLENIALDDPRLIQEAAIAADKADIREEVVRFRLHVAEAQRVLEEPGAAGKRLDFLSQELLREANTMGSKSPDAALSHLVVGLKSEIEKLKEQIQNLE
jgi:uncharacterized protein (TIGR00255 family)